MTKQFFAEYFRFSKKERNGTILLLLLIFILILVPFLFPLFIKEKTYRQDSFKKEIASLTIRQADTTRKYYRKNDGDDQPAYFQPSEKNYAARQIWKGELFYFDPNTLDETGWQQLGIPDKTIGTINNYLSKGGKFHKPEDIHKIWGLSDEEKRRLEPYIKIESIANKNSYPEKNYNNAATEKTSYSMLAIDVNTSDTTALIALPGIGSKLAQRIITFRDKLGGFYKIEQVGETFGLPDSTFQKIKNRLLLANTALKQININTATLDELKSHPYLRYAIANAIVQYRAQHGNFNSISDLKKMALVTDELFTKAAPYLKIN
ncbi:MAG: helix-hairpin-helix domain-containing protein [Chitinophagaceae bacterium]|nr:helix-hairpin-helix domain-containing protein [Chitinophagaceae bacterium]